MNHYYTRSFEEYEAKRVGGSATGRHERQALPFDIPTLATDESAMRFARARRSRYMDECAASIRGRTPTAAGCASGTSRARTTSAATARSLIATVAAGLDDPMGYGRVRIRNVYPGIGFVGDLGKAGRRARARPA